jgi:hypothetical protein
VLAFSAGAYDFYMGDGTVAVLTNASFYLTGGSGVKYGWTGAPCQTAAAAVCEMPSANYPCPSPPLPPTSPDAPAPLPPSIPLEASCGCLASPPLLTHPARDTEQRSPSAAAPGPCYTCASHTPLPPAPHTAGPPQESNNTFFCDQAACYGYQANRTIWPLARQACKRAGGDLVRLDAFDKQVRAAGTPGWAGEHPPGRPCSACNGNGPGLHSPRQSVAACDECTSLQGELAGGGAGQGRSDQVRAAA